MKQELITLEDYPYGYSRLGERCYALKLGKKRERVSWLSALKEGKLLAPLTFEGACNRDLFETWLKTCLLPQLKPGDIIIIDNASFHQGGLSKKLSKKPDAKFAIFPPILPT